MTNKRKQKSNVTIALVGLAAFLYQMQDLLRHHTGTGMDYYATPPGVGDIMFALLSGVIAMLAALGVDLHALVNKTTKEK